MRRAIVTLVGAALAIAGWTMMRAGPAAAAGDHAALVALSEEFQRVRRPPPVRGLPDYSADALAARRRSLADARGRLTALDPQSWPVSDRVDYLLVRAQIDAVDFDFRVMRPWSRDPGLYLDAVKRLPF